MVPGELLPLFSARQGAAVPAVGLTPGPGLAIPAGGHPASPSIPCRGPSHHPRHYASANKNGSNLYAASIGKEG